MKYERFSFVNVNNCLLTEKVQDQITFFFIQYERRDKKVHCCHSVCGNSGRIQGLRIPFSGCFPGNPWLPDKKYKKKTNMHDGKR